MDSYVRLLRKTSTDKLWLIIDKIGEIGEIIRTIIICPLITENYCR